MEQLVNSQPWLLGAHRPLLATAETERRTRSHGSGVSEITSLKRAWSTAQVRGKESNIRKVLSME